MMVQQVGAASYTRVDAATYTNSVAAASCELMVIQQVMLMQQLTHTRRVQHLLSLPVFLTHVLLNNTCVAQG